MTTLLYFAWVREGIGCETEAVDLEGPTTLSDLLDRLSSRSEGHSAILSDRSRLRAAVNQQFAGWDAIVHPGDEVAIFPPVTGG